MLNQRRTERNAVCTPGHIGCGVDKVLFCWVHNLSEHGAKLELVDAIHTPDQFLLILDEEDEGRWVETVWRRDMELGVRFLAHGSMLS